MTFRDSAPSKRVPKAFVPVAAPHPNVPKVELVAWDDRPVPPRAVRGKVLVVVMTVAILCAMGLATYIILLGPR